MSTPRITITTNNSSSVSMREFLESIVLIQNHCMNRQRNGYRYISLEDMLLKLGRDFTPSPLPKGIKRGRMGLCYMNAFHLATSGRGLTYCEGFGLKIIPVLHAWCVADDGKVIDPTWKEPEKCLYFGVPINRRFIARTMLRRKCYGVLDDWQNGWPVLKQPPAAWMERLINQ